MSAASTNSVVPERSFAQVAGASQLKLPDTITITNGVSHPDQSLQATAIPSASSDDTKDSLSPLTGVPKIAPFIEKVDVQNLTKAVEHLHVREAIHNDQELINEPKRIDLELSDDMRRAVDHEFPTKAPSFDDKSVASGITSALDEKESLRPDDSASMKAAEDEDISSGPASGAANSRVGSEAGIRPYRGQLPDLSDRMGSTQRHYVSGRFEAGAHDQRNITNFQQNTFSTTSSNVVQDTNLSQNAEAPPGMYSQEPDIKLMEALKSPKDRLFVLKLEQDVIDFVKDSKEPTLELPPCNSFYRLLAHKLADYYFLTHFVDNVANSVRIFRTPFCRLAPPLTAISTPSESQSTPPPSAPAVKIMRRGLNDLESGKLLDSGRTSRSGSEDREDSNNDESKDGIKAVMESLPVKDKANMTREEREAKYKEARERIFKGFEGSESANASPGNDESKDVSRSSSAIGKRKAKKQRSPNDDGFEARSQFNSFLPNQNPISSYVTGSQNNLYLNSYLLNSVAQPAPGGNGMDGSPVYGPMYPGMAQEPYNVASPYFNPPAARMSSPNMGQYLAGGYQPYIPQSLNGGQQYAIPQATQLLPGQISGIVQQPGAPQPTQQWNQTWNPNSYQRNLSPSNSALVQQPSGFNDLGTAQGSYQYPYGQLPSQSIHNGQAAQDQHPIPGSFNRSIFNPQTRSFVPAANYGHQNRNHPQPTFALTSFNGTSPMGQFPGTQGPLHLHRQTSNTSAPSTSDSSPRQQAMNGHQFGANGIWKGLSPSLNPPSNNPQSTLAKWGTPSHLPPKPPQPPSPVVTSQLVNLDGQHSLPARVFPNPALPPKHPQGPHGHRVGLASSYGVQRS